MAGITSKNGSNSRVENGVRRLISRSEAETTDLGRGIGESARGGELVRLIGPLGSGKSVLARGIARGLDVSGPVRSPSFNLMREYRGRLIFRHWDLYRLDGGFDELGLLESVESDALVVVEWAERWEKLERYASGTVFLDYGEDESARIIRWDGSVPGLGG
jgi:tRNA threonylcarbamoyladenosine biosynthesis protein TsaE